MDTKALCEKNKIVKMYSGSHAYGMALPTSDVDFRGIFCCDPINLLTPFFPVREYEDTSEEDTKYFELSHFVQKALDCNPNIVELLWTDDSDIVFRTPAYDLLKENRHKLLSTKIAHTTTGYAYAQLKRIKGHNKWINDPQPVQPPTQMQFISLVQNFTSTKLFKFDPEKINKGYKLLHYGNNIYGVYEDQKSSLFNKDGSLCSQYTKEQQNDFIGDGVGRKTPLLLVKYNAEEYKQSKNKHAQYWEWKNNRNEKRAVLEEEHGYDTKHASHLVRLLRMGEEALTQGEIIVKRPDAAELLDIRHGKKTYKELVEYAEFMENKIKNELYNNSVLPKKPNIKIAADLILKVQNLCWEAND